MKSLGTFSDDLADQYIDVLRQQGIEVEIEDIFKEAMGINAASYTIHNVQISVSEESYDIAQGILKDFDFKRNQRLEIESKYANLTMLKIAACLVGVIVLIGYVGYQRGWW